MKGIDVDRLAWTLIHFVWQGALIAALYALARQCLGRRAGPNFRYLLAWTALALMSVAPFFTWAGLRTVASASAVHAETLPASVSPAPAVADTGLAVPFAARPAFVPPAVLPWIAIFWCAGVLLFWTRLTRGCFLAARLRATCISPSPGEWQARLARLAERLRVARPVRLLVSTRVNAPAVVGWLRPVVLAPAYAFTGLAPAEMEAVLLHELAHIRRHDYLINLWQNAVEALLFYHPAVWWVSGHMRAEREFCCDDIAVTVSGNSLVYVRALEELEAARPRRPELAMAATGGSLLRRIARLLGPTRASSPAGSSLAAPVMVAGAILLCLSGFEGWGQAGQSAPLAFDVVSVKPSTQGFLAIAPQRSGGRITWTTDLTYLLGYAFHVPNWRITGPRPGSDHTYAVEATTSPEASDDQIRLMFQTLLKDRFQLAFHRTEKSVNGYAVTIAKGGSKLIETKPGDPPPPLPAWFVENHVPAAELEGKVVALMEAQGVGAIVGRSATMAQFDDALERVLQTAVVDQTGLAGKYYFALEFTQGDQPTESNVSPLFAAIGDLGLHLDRRKVPVEFLVIDHIDQDPIANR